MVNSSRQSIRAWAKTVLLLSKTRNSDREGTGGELNPASLSGTMACLASRL
jgi:hypothetical protein